MPAEFAWRVSFSRHGTYCKQHWLVSFSGHSTSSAVARADGGCSKSFSIAALNRHLIRVPKQSSKFTSSPKRSEGNSATRNLCFPMWIYVLTQAYLPGIQSQDRRNQSSKQMSVVKRQEKNCVRVCVCVWSLKIACAPAHDNLHRNSGDNPMTSDFRGTSFHWTLYTFA